MVYLTFEGTLVDVLTIFIIIVVITIIMKDFCDY